MLTAEQKVQRQAGLGGSDAAVVDRFMALLQPVTESGCWIWMGTTRHGYGLFWLHGKNRYAHIISHLLFSGPIPDGLHIDHLCRVRCCVNPFHLEPVTIKTNLIRGDGWAGRNARKINCPKGHPLSGENLVMRKGSRVCRQCERDHALAYYYSRKGSLNATHN